jgi:beta-fructofuranosidase
MIVGSGFDKVGGAVLLYTSTDGRNWTYLHPMAQGKWNQGTMVNPVDTGEMWECPDFFPLGGKHVLLYSTERKVYWEVGTFDKHDLRFHSETKGLLDHGSYYAMKSMVDAAGRRILWGWVQETRTPAQCEAAGWAGAMALPRILSLGADNQLCMDVPPEFASLRGETGGTQIKNRAGEIVCRFKPGDSACGLDLRAGAASLFAIRYQPGGKPMLNIGEATVPLSPGPDGISQVHLWIDGSVIEIFVDRKQAMTARSFKPSPDAIDVVWTGPKETLAVSSVKPISPDRLTS